MVRDVRILRVIQGLLFLGIALLFGLSPIKDPDLGWHLGGGLWMLEHGSVPRWDMFGPTGRSWINYSWLFQLPLAVVFKLAGFRGLQCLLVAMILLLLGVLAHWAERESHRLFRELVEPQRVVLGTVVALATTVLVAPIWSLRPQLMSLVFLAAVFLAPSGKARLPYCLVLTVLWSNFHVYWILAPLIYFLEGARGPIRPAALAKLAFGAGALFLCGAVSPYGVENIWAVLTYGADHSVAYRLITEFAPLSLDDGLLFWLGLGFGVFLVLRFGWIQSTFGTYRGILWLLFCGLAFWRIKFLPLFAVTLIPLFVEAAGCLIRRIGWNVEREKTSGKSILTLAVLTSLLLLLQSNSSLWSPAISPEGESLLLNSRELVESKGNIGATKVIVFNEFNDGGWLILGFVLAAGVDNRFKVAIDGRTLVAGEERILQYERIITQAPNWEKVFRSWNPDTVLVKDESLKRRLLNAMPHSLSES